MFEYRPYMNLCNGETVKERISVSEKSQGNGVFLVCVKALTGSMVDSSEKRAFQAEAGVCIEMIPTKKIIRFMADYKKTEFWCAPAFGIDMSEVPGETQLLVMEVENGEFCVVVPVVNDKYRCVLNGVEGKGIEAQLSSWCEDLYVCEGLAFAYAQGKNPNLLIKKCVKAALRKMNSDIRTIEKRRYP